MESTRKRACREVRAEARGTLLEEEHPAKVTKKGP